MVRYWCPIPHSEILSEIPSEISTKLLFFFQMEPQDSSAGASPPKIKRDVLCPAAPLRSDIFVIKGTDGNDGMPRYKASFPTTCVWKRLGLRTMLQEAQDKERKRMREVDTRRQNDADDDTDQRDHKTAKIWRPFPTYPS